VSSVLSSPTSGPGSGQPVRGPGISAGCVLNAATAQLNFPTPRVKVKVVLLFSSLGQQHVILPMAQRGLELDLRISSVEVI